LKTQDVIQMDKCILVDPEKVMVLPHDPGEPPSWGPVWAFPNALMICLPRSEFDELLKRKDEEPCDICPPEIKKKCSNAKPSPSLLSA